MLTYELGGGGNNSVYGTPSSQGSSDLKSQILHIYIYILILLHLFIYSLLTVLSLHCSHRLSPVAESGGYSLPATVVASLLAEHRLERAGSVVAVHGLSSCPVACGIFPERGSNL